MSKNINVRKYIMKKISLIYKMYCMSKCWFLKYFEDEKELCIKLALIYKGHNLKLFIDNDNDLVQYSVIKYCKEHKNEKQCKEILSLYNL